MLMATTSFATSDSGVRRTSASSLVQEARELVYPHGASQVQLYESSASAPKGAAARYYGKKRPSSTGAPMNANIGAQPNTLSSMSVSPPYQPPRPYPTSTQPVASSNGSQRATQFRDSCRSGTDLGIVGYSIAGVAIAPMPTAIKPQRPAPQHPIVQRGSPMQAGAPTEVSEPEYGADLQVMQVDSLKPATAQVYSMGFYHMSRLDRMKKYSMSIPKPKPKPKVITTANEGASSTLSQGSSDAKLHETKDGSRLVAKAASNQEKPHGSNHGSKETSSNALANYPGWKTPPPRRIRDSAKVLFFRMGGEVTSSVRRFLESRGWVDLSILQPHPTDPRPGTKLVAINDPSHAGGAGLGEPRTEATTMIFKRMCSQDSERLKRDAAYLNAVPKIWNLWWDDYGIASGLYGELRRTQMMNHILSGFTVSRKDILAETLERCIELYGQAYEFAPRTFRLPRQTVPFKRFFRRELGQGHVSGGLGGTVGARVTKSDRPKPFVGGGRGATSYPRPSTKSTALTREGGINAENKEMCTDPRDTAPSSDVGEGKAHLLTSDTERCNLVCTASDSNMLAESESADDTSEDPSVNSSEDDTDDDSTRDDSSHVQLTVRTTEDQTTGQERRRRKRRIAKRIWVHKPAAASRGVGIYLFTKFREFEARWVSEGRVPCVVQEYIRRPMLVGGYSIVPRGPSATALEARYGEAKPYKFDLRLYVLIKSVWPLEVYLHRRGLVRFGSRPYDLFDPENRLSHLTNFSLNRKSRRKADSASELSGAEAEDRDEADDEDEDEDEDGEDANEDSVTRSQNKGSRDGKDGIRITYQDLYNFPTAGPSGCKWILADLWDYLAQFKSVDLDVLWQEIKHIALLTVLPMMAAAVDDDTHADKVAWEKNNFPEDCGSADDPENHIKYELWGVDILLDANAVPYLIEVNRSPAMLISTPADQHVKPKVLHDVFNKLRIEERLLARKAKRLEWKRRRRNIQRAGIASREVLQRRKRDDSRSKTDDGSDAGNHHEDESASSDDEPEPHQRAPTSTTTAVNPTEAWQSYLKASLSASQSPTIQQCSQSRSLNEVVHPPSPVTTPETIGADDFESVFPLTWANIDTLHAASKSILGWNAERISALLQEDVNAKTTSIMTKQPRNSESIQSVTKLLADYVSQWNTGVFGSPLRGSPISTRLQPVAKTAVPSAATVAGLSSEAESRSTFPSSFSRYNFDARAMTMPSKSHPDL